MASYDASIRVGTKVDANPLREAQKEFDSLNKKLESLYEKGEKLESMGVDKQSKQWQSLKYDVAQTEAKLYDVTEKLQTLNATDAKEGFDKTKESGKKLFKVVQDGAKKSGSLLKTMGTRLKSIALSLLVFNWISKGFNAMVTSMKAGFQNLAKYSSGYNDAMSAMKSELAQVKNSLAVAFEPIVTAIIPYITQLVSWVNVAADNVARFLAVISGKSTYTKAKKQVVDYAASLDTASKAAQGALASFDSLNVLGSDSSSTGTSGGETTGADAFENVEVGEIGTGFQTVIDTIQPFIDSVDLWLANLDFTPLTNSFNNLKTACAPFAGYLAEGLLWFLNEVLLPISGWVIEDALPAFFNLLAEALDAVSVIWEAVQPCLAWLWDNFLAPAASWTGDMIIAGISGITDALTRFSDWATSSKENMDKVKTVVLGLFAGIMMYYTVKKIVTVIRAISSAIATFGIISGIASLSVGGLAIIFGLLTAATIILASNWGKLSTGEKVLAGLAAAALMAAVAVAAFHTAWSVGTAAVAILAGLTLLGLSAAVLFKSGAEGSLSAGTSFVNSQSFSSSPLPALATGGITTRPTTALIGENGREAVLPLENNTGWMDALADAFAERLTGRTSSSGGGTVILELDGMQLARAELPYINRESARIGTNLRKR